MHRKLGLGIAAAVLTVAFGGTAVAQFPEGVKSGAAPQSSRAMVTLAIPAVVGLNVGHNFVLDFSSATKCVGSGSSQTTFPQAPSGNTTYTFAVTATSIPSTVNVACPGAGAQPDIATIQVFSNLAGASHLQAGITDGGVGAAPVTAFSALIGDIFTGNRLSLAITSGDTCGGGNKGGGTMNLQIAAADQVTGIPKTGWSSCTQKLSLLLNPATTVSSGTATGTLTYTMVSP